MTIDRLPPWRAPQDSPEAPKASSLVPSVNVVVVNEAGEILLIRRTDNGNWALAGVEHDSADHGQPPKRCGPVPIERVSLFHPALVS
jgi:hypothetical protein